MSHDFQGILHQLKTTKLLLLEIRNGVNVKIQCFDVLKQIKLIIVQVIITLFDSKFVQ